MELHGGDQAAYCSSVRASVRRGLRGTVTGLGHVDAVVQSHKKKRQSLTVGSTQGTQQRVRRASRKDTDGDSGRASVF